MQIEICTRCNGTGKNLLGKICLSCGGGGAFYEVSCHVDDDEDDLSNICLRCYGTGLDVKGIDYCDYCQGDGYL